MNRDFLSLLSIPLSIIGVVIPILLFFQALAQGIGFRSDLSWVLLSVLLALLAGVFSSWLARAIRKFPHAPRVFLSYPQQEISVAKEIASALRKAGAKVWVDRENIQPGQDWKKAIETALADSDAIVTLLTHNPGQWLEPELQRALDHNVKVIPVLLEGTDVPAYLESIQAIDLTLGKERGIKQIVESST
jgi:hypothetical protein